MKSRKDALPERLCEVRERLGIDLVWSGPPELLRQATAAVVNSRKPRKLAACDRWVLSTLAAESHPSACAGVLVSSLGPLPYELAAWAAVRRGRPLILVLERPIPESAAAVRSGWGWDYAELLQRRETLLVAPEAGPGSRPGPRERRQMRDRIVEALADTIVAVEVRAGGTWLALLEERLGRGRRLLCGPALDLATAGNRVLLERGAEPIQLALPSGPASSGRQAEAGRAVPAPDPEAGPGLAGCLFHYTRGRPGPWPGQRRTEYLEELASGAAGAAHTGLDALLRILQERRIRASSRLIRGAGGVCCFTDRPPEAVAALARWSRGLLRWSFEPYAVGFKRAYALRKGLQRVLYLSKAAFDPLSSAERFRFQLHEPPEQDWTAEGEWRCKGDLRFDDAAPDQVVALVPSPEAAARVRKLCPFRVAVLGSGWPAV